jgi:hypothetical protein
MTPVAILLAVLQYGPTILPTVQQIATWIKSGKQDVTPDDIATLIALGKKTSADYLAQAGIQITADGKVTPLAAS